MRGKYIVLEGPEGVGKTTQIDELARRLQAAGLPVRTLREPDSQSDLTARALRQLTQDPRYPMNTNTEVLLYNAARSQSLQVIKKSVEQGIICIVDRNYLTTLAIQYYGRGDVADYDTINSMISFAVQGVEPDLCIVMDAPVQTLKERAKFRGQGERFDNLDEAFLERVRAGYLWEARQRNLPVIFATEDQQTVTENIWKLVTETLAIRGGSKALAASEPTSVKQIIDQKKQAASPHEPPLDAAMATPPVTNVPNASLSLTLENASQLLLSALQTDDSINWYLATPQQLATGQRRQYFMPPRLDAETSERYRQKLDAILELHDSLVADLATHLRTNPGPVAPASHDAASDALQAQAEIIGQAVLPVATESTIGIEAAPKALKTLLQRLANSPLAEAQAAAQTIWEQAHAVRPTLFGDAERPQINTSTTPSKVRELATSYLPDTYTDGAAPAVTLTDVWPKTELAIVADMLYAHSNLPLSDMASQIDGWSYDKKAEVFTTYLAEEPTGYALQKIHYSWDVVSNYDTFAALQPAQLVQVIERQPLTPRYGYDTPEFIEEAGLSDRFEECFSLSLELYSILQEAGYADEAQYAVLGGHKLRYKLRHTASDIVKLAQLQSNPPLHILAGQLHDKIAEIHPLLAEAIGSQDSPATTRP